MKHHDYQGIAKKGSRIDLVDILRGFSLIGILFLHHVEHFNLFTRPDAAFQQLAFLDSKIWSASYFLFSGKAYAIFALLFGFSFWVQFAKAKSTGNDFSLRFTWRMALLMVVGLIHTAFFSGDILLFYAVLSSVLLMTRNWSDRALVCSATLLLLQPVAWFHCVRALLDHTYVVPEMLFKSYFPLFTAALESGSFTEAVLSNFRYGKPVNMSWFWSNGRVLQTLGLFLAGVLIARNKIFSIRSIKFWAGYCIAATSAAAIALVLRNQVASWGLTGGAGNEAFMALNSYKNVLMAAAMVSGLAMIWNLKLFANTFDKLSLLGRMSLTNYVVQGLSGALLYYGYGLALYHYCGSTVSLLIACLTLAVQLKFSAWWLAKHRQGPLEFIWKKTTWVFDDRRMPAHPSGGENFGLAR